MHHFYHPIAWAVDGDYIYRGLTEDSATMVRNLITSQIA